ncbi:MAG: DUF4738 domain-containing protein [Paraprevotella sp.]|nr:DUF4738 domain-containing protein [Paraprevotella sp.]
MKRITWSFCLWLLLLAACRNGTSSTVPVAENEGVDVEAQSAFQGIWIDDDNDNVLFQVKGDSVFYPDTVNRPVRFYIKRDTLVMVGEHAVSYSIEKQGTDIFQFRVSTGDLIRLKRSYNPDDTLLFERRYTAPMVYNEVVKKDTVVYGNGARYHCYVFVNPSKYKVVKTGYTDESIAVENVYYDNVVHLSIYQGKECLFSKDFMKKDFSSYVPASFLSQAILANADFMRIDKHGCHFGATLCIPDAASCYVVGVCVGFDGTESMSLLEY